MELPGVVAQGRSQVFETCAQEKQTVSDLVVEHLVALDVDTVFGIPGGATIPFHNSIEKHDKIKFVLTRHEGGAAFMADCYARVSGGIGVCCATTGPGATNLATGIAAAYMDSVPLLVISGMNPIDAWGRGDFQECSPYAGVDTTLMFKSMCKSSEVIVSEKTVQQRLRYAVSTALSGRPGPVHLAIPRDLWSKRVHPEPFDMSRRLPTRPAPSKHCVDEVARLLLTSANPLVIYGSGVSANGLSALFTLCERFSFPILSTPRAKGKGAKNVPDVYMGHVGIAANSLADQFIASNSFDVVLAIGSSLGSYATNSWDLRLVARDTTIQVNIDPTALGRSLPVDIGIVSDAEEFIFMLGTSLENHDCGARTGSRWAWLRDWRGREKWVPPSPSTGRDTDAISPAQIIRAVDDAASENAIVSADSNSILLWATHYFPERPGRRFLSFWGAASMGHATAGAIGVKRAAPNADVIALVGDGCFLMNGTEVATAVALSLPIVWIVNVNAQLGMIHYELRASNTTGCASLGTYDFAGLARSLGAIGIVCNDPNELPTQIRVGLRADRPTVIQVDVDPSLIPPMGMKKEGSARWKAYMESL